MQERIATLNIGDWSDDGHGRMESVRVKKWGEDVSNECLVEAKNAAVKASGVHIEELFEDYEGNSISHDVFDKIIQSGIQVLTSEHSSDITFFVGDDEEGEYTALSLLMGYLGFGIDGFAYEIIKDDVIVGGYEGVINSYGYGLL